MSTLAELATAFHVAEDEYQAAIDRAVNELHEDGVCSESLSTIARGRVRKNDPKLVERFEGAKRELDAKGAQIREEEADALKAIKVHHEYSMERDKKYEEQFAELRGGKEI